MLFPFKAQTSAGTVFSACFIEALHFKYIQFIHLKFKGMSTRNSGRRGFASMDPEERRQVARRGGQASHGSSNYDQDYNNSRGYEEEDEDDYDEDEGPSSRYEEYGEEDDYDDDYDEDYDEDEEEGNDYNQPYSRYEENDEDENDRRGRRSEDDDYSYGGGSTPGAGPAD